MAEAARKPKNTDLIIPAEKLSSQDRNRLEPSRRGLKVLNPTGKDHEEYKEDFAKKPRLHYAGMRAHQELAAQALAVGTTQKMAAHYAGVSQRQIKKYYQDPDFRSRIQELRSVLGSRIVGRIYKELGRRVTGKNVKNLEIMDMMRMLDRLSSGGKGMAINIEGDVNVNNKYENILAALFNPDAANDGEDLPIYGDQRLRLPSEGSPE